MTAVRAHTRPRLAGESGFTIVEVLATALVVLILAAGAMTGFDASSKASGRAKSRAIATTLAQSDQERMRALPTEQLANLRTSQTRTQRLCDDTGGNCVTYTIASQADWVKDGAGVQSCTSGTSGFDYLNLTSTVTWPNIGPSSPVVSKSIYTPPPGTFGTGQGAIAVKVVRADGTTPVQGATVQLTGAKTYTDVTNASGCVFWGVLPVGSNYSVTTTLAGSVTPNGAPVDTQAASVSAQAVTTTTVLLDQASSATLRFVVRDPATNTIVPDTLDQATLVNAGMITPRVFGTPGTAASTLVAPGLFPFTSGYQVYGGGCSANSPSAQSPSDSANAQYLSGLVAGQDKGTVDIALPAFDMRVQVAGSTSLFLGGSNGVNMADATAANEVRFRVLQTTSGCANPPAASVQSAAAQSANPSRPDSPGYPYGTYTVCAEAKVNGTKVSYPGSATTSNPSGPIYKPGVIAITATDTAGTCNAAF